MIVEVYDKESTVIEDDQERALESVRAEESTQNACWQWKATFKDEKGLTS